MSVTDVTRLHRWHHDDYAEAKRQIYMQLGDLSGLEVFGRQVAVAVYVRPEVNSVTGLYQTQNSMREDWWQGKAVLVLKMGPDAFRGDDGYIMATFPGGRAPQIGDWLFANANAGIQTSYEGPGGAQFMVENRQGEMEPVYSWFGWPIRIIPDDMFLGRVHEPHQVI
jgi:hypothetical protein